MENKFNIGGDRWEIPWKLYGPLMEDRWSIDGVSKGNRWISMGNLWKVMEIYRKTIEILWTFYGNPMGNL